MESLSAVNNRHFIIMGRMEKYLLYIYGKKTQKILCFLPFVKINTKIIQLHGNIGTQYFQNKFHFIPNSPFLDSKFIFFDIYM